MMLENSSNVHICILENKEQSLKKLSFVKVEKIN